MIWLELYILYEQEVIDVPDEPYGAGALVGYEGGGEEGRVGYEGGGEEGGGVVEEYAGGYDEEGVPDLGEGGHNPDGQGRVYFT